MVVGTGATVWRDSASNFAGITGSVLNSGTINQNIQGFPVASSTPVPNAYMYWNGSSWVSQRILTTQTPITSATNLSPWNLYPVDTTSGAVTVTLPSGSVGGGSTVAIQLKSGSNPVTIIPTTGVTINGSLSSIQLTNPGQSVYLTYYANGNSWYVF
ncbi:MAG: hypothetical protein EBS18_06595, partial [Actinobacteria bacterium]|nr:hypothetical protein [Actinomycetota bacterium]